MDLTRWRDDPTIDDWGSWIYVEDRMDGRLWSVTPQPTLTIPDHSETLFMPHRVEFERQDGELLLRTTIGIAPEDDVEIRRITLTNHGNESRLLAFTSYAEIILAQQSTDLRHPAISIKCSSKVNIFPMKSASSSTGGRAPKRKNRSTWCIFLLPIMTKWSWRDMKLTAGFFWVVVEQPGARECSQSAMRLRMLSRTVGATLDPICALQAEVTLAAYETVQLAFITLTAGSRREALQLAYRYRRWSQIDARFPEFLGQNPAGSLPD